MNSPVEAVPALEALAHDYGDTSTVELFGLPIRAARMGDALRTVHAAVKSRLPLHIGVVNAAKIVNMRKNPALEAAIRSSHVIYADGMSIVWAGRLLRAVLPERVAGIDLMNGILQQGNAHGYRVYCLGATEFVVQTVCEKFRREYPGTTIAGFRNGYFSEAEEQDVARAIRDSRADVLFVAITSPKKEQFMARWGEFMSVPVVHGVGGSFDVEAGLVRRAPGLWQSLGMEWLYRLLQEPGRLWKRYLITNVSFARIVLTEAFGKLFLPRKKNTNGAVE